MPVKAGYTYWKEVTVNHTADGAQDNYQMKVLVGESSGATGEDVDCNGHCLSTFNDLWFQGYDADGVTVIDLDYWIESITGTTPNQLAKVWVEIHYIPAHPDNTTVWMSYGKAGASAASSGANTFNTAIEKRFSNFETGNDGDTIADPNTTWTEITAHVHVSTDHAHSTSRCAKLVNAGGGVWPTASSPVTASANIAFRYWIWPEDVNDGIYFFHGNGTYYLGVEHRNDERVRVTTNTDWQLVPDSCVKDSWNVLEITDINFIARTWNLSINGGSKASGGMIAGAGNANVQAIYIYAGTAGREGYYDDMCIRNYTANEPTWGAWGAEQSASVKSSVPNIARIIVMNH